MKEISNRVVDAQDRLALFAKYANRGHQHCNTGKYINTSNYTIAYNITVRSSRFVQLHFLLNDVEDF